MWGVFRRRPVLPKPSQSAAALATLSAGIQTFPLLADAGAFTVVGQDTGAGISLLCEPASFAVAGQDSNYIAAQGLIADGAAFVLTAIDASLPQTFVCDAGAFALDGQATLFTGRLSADAASFALGEQAVLFADYLTSSTASFTLSGQDALFAYRLVADAASFALDGQAALFSGSLSASVGSFALSGQALLFTDQMVTEAASFALSGQAANQSFAASVGAFELSGQSVTFSESWVLSAATFDLAGQSAQQAWAASAGAFTLAGQDAALFTSIGLIASGATFSLTGKAAFSIYSPATGPSEGAVAEYAVTEFPQSDISLSASVAAFVFSGQAALFQLTLPAVTASFTLDGQTANQSWATGAAAYVLSGQAALFTGNVAISAGSFILSGQDANQAWPVGVASFTLIGIDTLYTLRRTADAAAFVLTAVDVHFLDLETATFTLSGQETAFSASLSVSAGAFTFAGVDAEFINAKIMPADPGAFTVSAQDAFVVRSFASDPATFVLSGQSSAELVNLLIGAASFTLGGQSLALNLALTLSTGQFTVLGWAIADVMGPEGDPLFLVEVQAHNGSTIETFYLATEGFTSQVGDSPSNQHYTPRVMDPGNFQQRISLPGESDVSASAGDVVIANGDAGDGVVLDSWLTKGFGGRPITIKSLPQGAKSLSLASTLFRGRTGKLSSTRPLDQFEITISNKLSDLEKPLLTTRYAGTTTSSAATAEGNADLKGQIKQQVWGEASNIVLQPANPYDLIYLASNSTVVSITVYDGGLALTNDGNETSIANLRSASISAGHYKTCLSLGLVRLGGSPEKTPTADVVEGATSADRTAAQIVKRMLLQFGVDVSELSTGSFSDLDTKNDAICYSVVNDDRNALEEMQAILNSIGGRMLPNRNDLFEVTRLEAPTTSPLLTFDIDSKVISDTIQRLEGSPPVYQVSLLWGRVHHPQQESDLAGAVTAERRAYLGQEIRTSLQEDSSVLTKHLDARIISIETRLAYQADADTEADRILDLMKVERDEYSVTLPLSEAWAAQVGGSITLVHPRLGLTSGKDFVVLTRSDEYVKETVTFDRVWG